MKLFAIGFAFINISFSSLAMEISPKRVADYIVDVDKEGHYFSDCIGVLLPDNRVLTFSDCVSGVRPIVIKNEENVEFEVNNFSGTLKENNEIFLLELATKPKKNAYSTKMNSLDGNEDKLFIAYQGTDGRPNVQKVNISERFDGGFKTKATNFSEGSIDNTRHVFAFDLKGQLVGYMKWAGIWEDDYRTFSSDQISNPFTLEDEKRLSEYGLFLGFGDINLTWIPDSENHPFWFPVMVGIRYNEGLAGVGYNLIDRNHKFFVSHPIYHTSSWKYDAQIGVRSVKFSSEDNGQLKYVPELKLSASISTWIGFSIIVLPTANGAGIGYM